MASTGGPRRGPVALAWIAFAAPACPERPPGAPLAPAEVAIAPAPDSSTTSEIPPPRARKPAPPAPVARRTAIGDVSCFGPTECVVTTRADCCDCCPSEPVAAARGWLTWRDQSSCPAQPCEPCGSAACPRVQEANAFRAACENERCTLVPFDRPAGAP